MTLVDRVFRTIEKERLMPPGSHVLCAVSGGADSTALLCLLRELSERLHLTLAAAHVNHMLRGEESDRDEAFVRTLCKRLEIPLFVKRVDVASLVKAMHQSVETAAREARYGFFASLMEEQGINILVTAHTAKDNLETALFHLARGTAIAGLAGIPLTRELEGGTLVRPLLYESREVIEEYLRDRQIPFVTDSTNASDAYTRNRIRQRILPELEQINPSLYDTAAQTQRLLRQDADFIRFAVDAAYRDLVKDGACNASALSALHPAVSGRLIMRLYRELAPDGAQLTAGNIDEVLAAAASSSPSACAMLPGGVMVTREYETLRFGRSRVAGALIPRALSPGVTTDFPEAGLAISCYYAPKSDMNLRNIQKLYFDSSHICGILSVRARTSGDRIHLAGHDHSKSVKKALIDAKIPQAKRDLIPVIQDDCGIAGVFGMGTAQRLAVSDTTDTVLVLEMKNLMEDTNHDDGI